MQEETYIDPYDIEVLKRWLKLAKAHGTKAIKIVAGEEANTYKVTVHPDYLYPRKKGKGVRQ